MNSIEGTVSVSVGNIVAIALGDPATSRQQAFTQFALPTVITGFDAALHKMVIPQTPFKTGSTTDRWPDKGLHITVAQEGRDVGSGAKDVVSQEAMQFNGEKIAVEFDPSTVELLEGLPANDEAVGCVYYLSLGLSEATNQRVNALREKMKLPAISASAKMHISIAGVCPLDGDMKAFRDTYCPPRPATGFPAPLKALQQTNALVE